MHLRFASGSSSTRVIDFTAPLLRGASQLLGGSRNKIIYLELRIPDQRCWKARSGVTFLSVVMLLLEGFTEINVAAARSSDLGDFEAAMLVSW
jgi:hypothetical protein